MSTPKRHPVALNLPRTVPLLIIHARHVVLAMTDNAWFPAPTPALADVSARIDALEAAEVAVRTRAIGAVPVRDLCRGEVEEDMLALGAYVRQIATQHREAANAIITSAGLSPKRYSRAPKPDLAASMGSSSDEVALCAKSRGRGTAYEWQYSLDGGQTWIAAGVTSIASTSIFGLALGTAYLFRFRTTRRRATSEWSQTIRFIVH
jgi:hypothetical protein